MTVCNIDWFDIPYLWRRLLKVLSFRAYELSPIRLVQYNDRRQKYQIAGIASLDYLALYKKFTYTDLPNYRLDTVGKYEIDMGKYEYEGTLDDLRQNDIVGFLKYNLRDNDIVQGIDDKMKLIDLVMGICSVGHVPYEDFEYSSRWLEGALITYLHRKNIIAPNRSPTARQEMEEKQKSDKANYGGAFVKPPMVGLHKWVFSLDLQSLYPSIIMSLNISPETKVGKVENWNVGKHSRKEIEEYHVLDGDGKVNKIGRARFLKLMHDGQFSISSNGIMYRTDQTGMIPDILDKWFEERVVYKNKMKDAAHSGDTTQQDYWDMRQHIQKIFLNSLYGVLGLPIFRFYDVDNALATTATGQDIIKTTARCVNNHYNQKLGTEHEDYCIYSDTDSVYFSVSKLGEEGCDWKSLAIATARQTERDLNIMYDAMAPRLFFIPGKHRFVIKGETIAATGFWVTKKRYAMKKVYDLETDQDVDKITIKGLDAVKSNFPTAFKSIMKELLSDILNEIPKADIDAKVLAFRKSIPDMPIVDVARNTATKSITKWAIADQILGKYIKGTPAHYKAAISHNLLLHMWKINLLYLPIRNGDKIKWIYIKQNPYGIESVAFFGDEDAPLIIKFAEKFIDYDKLFEKEFEGKLLQIYSALGWGNIPTRVNQLAQKFFEF